MSQETTGKTAVLPKPRNTDLVRRSYQPKKSEKEEPFNIKATLEQLTQAVVQPVKVRWLDKPRVRR